ncbi:hypothetical protein L6452_26715 [Arctium lappa]|uniref:Uncharacterized protein n=1 Tax=Arctium lappa TaxID=4217 RepID=A0ACB8ZZH0_ARCLA|nr:hypothetical protein L6452_26715 [Arctium lappa]
MATGAAGDGMFQRLYGGCISTDEMVVRRRPYHNNCNCALHKFSGGGHCSPVGKVSYPMRRSWSEGSMAAMNSSMVQTIQDVIESFIFYPSDVLIRLQWLPLLPLLSLLHLRLPMTSF